MPLNSINHQEMITKSAGVLEALTPERYAYLLSLLPTPESYAQLHERYEASYAASLKGDPEKLKACEQDRQAVSQDLSILMALAKAVTVKDPTVPSELRLAQVSEKSHIPQPLSKPQDMKLVFDRDGHLSASVVKVEGAKGYQVWVCDGDPTDDANWRLVASSSACRAIAVMGLNRSKYNWLRIRAVRGNNFGPWSNFVTLPPTD